MVARLCGTLRGASTTGVCRGTLRALGKLCSAHGLPESVAAQLLACSGVAAVAARLDMQDLGVVRRCLDILLVAAVLQGPESAAQFLEVPGAGASLVGLLRSSLADIQEAVMALMQCLTRCGGMDGAWGGVGRGLWRHGGGGFEKKGVDVGGRGDR